MYLCVTARLSYSSKKRDGVGLIETNHGRINATGESSLRAPWKATCASGAFKAELIDPDGPRPVIDEA
jgi:hypothetical protein